MKLRKTFVATLLLIVSLVMPNMAVFAAGAGVPAAAPAVPRQESPANGATNLSPTVTVTWSLSNPGETYRVQIAQNRNFTSLVADARVSNATGYTVFNLRKDTVYYWRVNATAGRQTSRWSPVWSFRTTNQSTLPAPTLVSPANGATGVRRGVTLVWNAVPGADSYDIEVFGQPGMNRYAHVGTSIVFNVDPAYNKNFTWRVRARNAAGAGEWSQLWGFTMVR